LNKLDNAPNAPARRGSRGVGPFARHSSAWLHPRSCPQHPAQRCLVTG
jgi:hypothetical protein